MNALVIGYGSIGSRHARVLESLGCRVSVVSSREGVHERGYATIAEALEAETPGYVVVAAPTAAHGTMLTELAACGFDGTVLAEKPLLATPAPLPEHRFAALYVGYNLRFHPAVLALLEALAGAPAISVQAYVGQWLPGWRGGRDYREGYSASAEAGGGALRDLSHELDLVMWLFGGVHRVAALGGHFSSLATDADDVFGLLAEQERSPVTLVQMNVLDRAGRRALVVNTDGHTYEVDLIAHTFAADGETTPFAVGRDDTYCAEHTAALAGDASLLCSADEGLAVVRTVAAAETAATEGRWVEP